MVVNSITKTQKSFSGTVVGEYGSSVDIDNSSSKQLYTNNDMKQYKTTSNKIYLYENLLMTKYYPKIKASCKKQRLSNEDKIRYKYRPEMLSSDIYGTTSLWYLLLFVNSCEDFTEFDNMDYILIPDISVINECIMNEEYIVKKPAQ